MLLESAPTRIAMQLARARDHYRLCSLCEHRCGANRLNGERGPCKAGVTPRVYRHRVEYSEESELVPAHLFYLSGCDLRCAFCIAELDAFDPRRGEPLTKLLFEHAVDWGRSQGARTLQWVGGEPTIHLPSILEVMAECHDLPPIVWKSDFYFTPEALFLLRGAVDVFLADFKFGNDICARRIAGVDRYTETVTRNLMAAANQTDLIVRHLLLPGHFDCCFRLIVHWMRKHLPSAKFSIRDGYLPRWQARLHAELERTLEPAKATQAVALAGEAGLNLVW